MGHEDAGMCLTAFLGGESPLGLPVHFDSTCKRATCGASRPYAPEPRPSPALWAMRMVDDSFRDQLELLRQAAARHRGLLEKRTQAGLGLQAAETLQV